jgi:hypothetical protein
MRGVIFTQAALQWAENNLCPKIFKKGLTGRIDLFMFRRL